MTKIIKITSDKEVDHFILMDSEDMQDVMFAVEEFARERRTPRITAGREKISDQLMFNAYGDCEFRGYGTNDVVTFRSEVVSYREYNPSTCQLTEKMNPNTKVMGTDEDR